jgi:nucleoside-diphosphate-sugar epimerase
MKILVIGGTGLISTPLTRQLLEAGHEVVHYNRAQRPVRLPDGIARPRVIVGDRQNLAAFERQIAESGRWDAVIDMCCYEPEEAQSVVRAFKGRTGQLVFTSTVDAFAKPPRTFPIRESDPTGGLTVYGQKKATCERVLLDAHDRGELAVTIIRPAQSTGEGGYLLDPFGGSSHFIDRMRKGLPIIVHGDGQSLWTVLDVEDLSGAYVAALGNPRTLGRAYDVTGEEWLTWNQIYARIAEALGRPCPELVHIPTDFLAQALPVRARECLQNFQFNNIFDTSAARRDLGFRQTIRFVDIARRVIRWLVDNDELQRAEDAPYYDAIIRVWKEHTSAAAAALGAYDKK